MIKALLFLTAVALSHGDVEERLKEPHPDCPEYGHQLLAHEYDCTKFYYCEDGEKFIEATNCAPGTEFSVTEQVCIHPSLAGCELPGYPPSGSDAPGDSTTAATQTPTGAPTAAPTQAPGASTTQPPNGDPTAATQAPTSGPNEATTLDSCEYFDNGCPVDFEIHVLLPHETSCRKFYYCVRGEKVLSKCSRGSVFNPATQICDHPGSIDRTCEDEDSSSEEDASTEESQSSEEIERHPNGCPVDWSISAYLPHENYCNLYYQCIFGQLVERRCGDGTHFNPTIQACDHIENVGCTLPGGDASFSDETEDSQEEDALTPVKPPTDLLDNGCPVDGSIHWLVPHEDDCTKFYFCVWGSLVVSQCPGGLHFSPTLQSCENPAIAGCICKDKDCSNECSGESCSSEVDKPVADDSETEEDLPAGDDENDSSSEEDDLPSGDDPNGGNDPECSEESNEEKNICEEECNVLPWADEDCNKFWMCKDRKPVRVVCSEGLHFNPNTHTCDFICNVDCVRGHIQTTAGHDGLRIFFPWDKIDERTKELLKIIAN